MKTNNLKTIKHHQSDENSKIYPFGILERESGFTPTLGNKLVTKQEFKTKAECKQYILSKPLGLLTALMCFVVEQHAEYQKEQVELLNSRQHEVHQ